MKTTCSVDGCEKPVSAHGYCGAHDARYRRLGDPLAGGPTRQRAKGTTCAAEGCDAPTYGVGLCSKHYQRQRRTGTTAPRPINLCSVDGCDARVHGHGWCRWHWESWRATGDPLGRRVLRGAPAEERFWIKVDQNGPIPASAPALGRCWVWTAALNAKGYGTFECLPAHRWLWIHERGPLLHGLVLDHLCRNRGCVRPTHLEPVTPQENTRRGGNGRKTRCPNGHPYDFRYRDGRRGCRTCLLEWRRRRHAVLVAQTLEIVDRDTVFERDEGVCGICGQPVDPRDWDLDHVVPISRGGAHAYANVRVSHPACNRRKQSKLDEEF